VLAGQVQFGKRVVVVDQLGDHRATSVAEFLAEHGCEVEILSPSLYVGQELGVTLDLETWQRRASRLGIRLTPNVSVLSVEGRSLNAIHNYSGEMVQLENLDTIVLVVPALAHDQLYFELKGKVPELHRIGDCLSPRRAHAAIIEGERVGRLL
jgi:2,4-dienoyl-CoA reductase (NADPH2)